jgi:hypothetical protein
MIHRFKGFKYRELDCHHFVIVLSSKKSDD